MAAGPRPGRRLVIELWDGRCWPCSGRYAGLPVFRFRWAPSGLATVRQLAALGLRPGGQDVAAWLAWGPANRPRWAYLYRLDLAKPKRVPTAAQREALARAEAVLRTCRSCDIEQDYRVRRSLGECWPCAVLHEITTEPVALAA